MGKKITLTENDLKRMVNETVKKIIKEYYGTFDDTSSAPWNRDYDGVTDEKVDYWDEYYMDLTNLIERNHQLQKILSPMIDNPNDKWSYCNVGPVEIHYNVERSDYEQDEEGYSFSNNNEIDEDSIEVLLDKKKNKYANLLPDKLVTMIESEATEYFKKSYDTSDLEG